MKLNFDPELCRNEAEVESKLIVQYLLPKLGYSQETWHQEVEFGNIRLDFLAFATQQLPLKIEPNSPLTVVMEAKHPRENLDDHIRKLHRYLTRLSLRFGLLTNGKEIRIYERVGDELVLRFRCAGTEVGAKLEQIRALIGKDSLKVNQSISVSDPAIAVSTNLPEDPPETSPNSSAGDRAIPKSVNLVTRQTQSNMKTIAVYHNKGGVGKTTTVIHLAAAFRKKGKRVLIIDMDSQANTTFATGLVKFDDEQDDDIKDSNIYHILRSKEFYKIPEVARKSQFTDPEIDVIPAHIMLMKEEVALNNIDYSRGMLIKKLDAVKDSYDIVLIDTPPSLNLYARTALISADYLLIPSDLKPFANQGLMNVKELFNNSNEYRNTILGKPLLQVLGIVACKISTNAKFVQHTLSKRLEVIPKRYGINVLDTIIYDRDDLAKCTEKTKKVGDREVPDPISIFDYKNESKSAQEFELLALEIGQKIGVTL